MLSRLTNNKSVPVSSCPGFFALHFPAFLNTLSSAVNNREPCFYAEEDYGRYLDDLKETASKYGCHVHAYVLMINHVHLLLTPTDKGMKWGQVL